MKATHNGIHLKGTPQEIAEYLRLSQYQHNYDMAKVTCATSNLLRNMSHAMTKLSQHSIAKARTREP